MNNQIRCSWANSSEKMQAYHDNIWGVPVYDDLELFKRLALESMQSGLSWSTILNKYEDLCIAFDDFNPHIMKDYTQDKFDQLLSNSKIIRHKLKITAMRDNAIAYFKMIDDHESFSKFLWNYVNNETIVNVITDDAFYTQSDISVQISKALKKYGFKFIGPTTIYAFMQSIGMVDDHHQDCFKKTK